MICALPRAAFALKPGEPVPDSTLIQAARDLRELIESEADEIEARCTMTQPVVDAIEETA